MFILFLGALALGFAILKVINSGDLGHKRCEKQHHWILRFENGDKRGYLICKECDHIPGEE